MFQTRTNLRSLVAAFAISAGSGMAFAAQPSAIEYAHRRTSSGPDLGWASIKRNKPWGGSVKRHARAAAKTRRQKGAR